MQEKQQKEKSNAKKAQTFLQKVCTFSDEQDMNKNNSVTPIVFGDSHQ